MLDKVGPEKDLGPKQEFPQMGLCPERASLPCWVAAWGLGRVESNWEWVGVRPEAWGKLLGARPGNGESGSEKGESERNGGRMAVPSLGGGWK